MKHALKFSRTFFVITGLALSFAFFATVIIGAQHTPDACFYPAWYPEADRSNCWKNVPLNVMLLLVLPGYGIFILAVWIRYRAKNPRKIT